MTDRSRALGVAVAGRTRPARRTRSNDGHDLYERLLGLKTLVRTCEAASVQSPPARDCGAIWTRSSTARAGGSAAGPLDRVRGQTSPVRWANAHGSRRFPTRWRSIGGRCELRPRCGDLGMRGRAGGCLCAQWPRSSWWARTNHRPTGSTKYVTVVKAPTASDLRAVGCDGVATDAYSRELLVDCLGEKLPTTCTASRGFMGASQRPDGG